MVVGGEAAVGLVVQEPAPEARGGDQATGFSRPVVDLLLRFAAGDDFASHEDRRSVRLGAAVVESLISGSSRSCFSGE